MLPQRNHCIFVCTILWTTVFAARRTDTDVSSISVQIGARSEEIEAILRMARSTIDESYSDAVRVVTSGLEDITTSLQEECWDNWTQCFVSFLLAARTMPDFEKYLPTDSTDASEEVDVIVRRLLNFNRTVDHKFGRKMSVLRQCDDTPTTLSISCTECEPIAKFWYAVKEWSSLIYDMTTYLTSDPAVDVDAVNTAIRKRCGVVNPRQKRREQKAAKKQRQAERRRAKKERAKKNKKTQKNKKNKKNMNENTRNPKSRSSS